MNHHSSRFTAPKAEIDPGIKGLVALVLAVLACLSNTGWNMAVLAIYLLIITALLIDDYRFVVKNLVSYGIIFVLPYLVGLSLSLLLGPMISGGTGMTGVDLDAAAVKLLKIFFVWYIGSLYFFTTPFVSVAEMLAQLLGPLNRLGVSVTKYLIMVVWIVDQLTLTVDHFMEDVFVKARQVFKADKTGIRSKLKELADILAGFIANSLSQTESVQSAFSQAGLNSYRPKVAGKEILAVLSALILILLLYYPPLR